MKTSFRIVPLLLISFFTVQIGLSHEGMWIPMLLGELNGSHLKASGLKITPEQIYSANKSSLKDAVMLFGGGCTAEIISDQGLLLTNHHCGYGRIQSHSSLENDYLKNGFWAKTKADELANEGLTVTRIVRMKDVTDQVLKGISMDETGEARYRKIQARIAQITEEAVKDTHYEAMVKPFYHGNQYYMFVTEVFRDVRLVGAPPSSIGKFGFDTDNWVWPRHTGDFSLFRIYVGKDNKPAEYSKDNVPYKPLHHLPINLKGQKKDDFSMIYGFPGSTSEYLTSYAVDYILNKSNPARIKMRKTSLGIIDKAMRSNDKVRIQYASKQSRISNAYKKWIGQSKGLTRLKAIERKQTLEKEFQQKTQSNSTYQEQYGSLLSDYEKVYKEQEPYSYARDYFIELIYYGPEILRFSSRFSRLVDLSKEEATEEKINEQLASLRKATDRYFKNYDLETDKALFKAMVPIYKDDVDAQFHPALLTAAMAKGSIEDFTEKLYSKSIFSNKENVLAFLDGYKASAAKKLEKDPAYKLTDQMFEAYQTQIKPKHNALGNQLVDLDRMYMDGLMKLMKDKTYYPDANSTLRLAYGKVEGYHPQDGVTYKYYTTLDGIIEKYIPDSYEFDVPDKLIELYNNKDYGQYGEDGVMKVCYLASNHTTGGNSGSPALDANGQLVGLNFDRTWESTMSDIIFDPDICRNIMVDIRYVLFIIDKFAGAKHLVDEMTLVKN